MLLGHCCWCWRGLTVQPEEANVQENSPAHFRLTLVGRSPFKVMLASVLVCVCVCKCAEFGHVYQAYCCRSTRWEARETNCYHIAFISAHNWMSACFQWLSTWTTCEIRWFCWDLGPLYPRDAMLARYLLSSRDRPFVRQSVRHKPVLYQNG